MKTERSFVAAVGEAHLYIPTQFARQLQSGPHGVVAFDEPAVVPKLSMVQIVCDR